MDDVDFAARRRPHAPFHRRTIDMQMLDALIRIEELLTPKAVEPVKSPLSDPKLKRK